MRKSLLNPKAYKLIAYALVVGIIVILILPLLRQKTWGYSLIGIYLFLLGDWLCTFLQHRSVNLVISLILGYVISFVVCIILTFYTICIGG